MRTTPVLEAVFESTDADGYVDTYTPADLLSDLHSDTQDRDTLEAVLRAAIDLATLAKKNDETATATLEEATLQVFRLAATRHASRVAGIMVLTDTRKKRATEDVWHAAAGVDAVKTTDRSKGQKSMATYLTAMVKVATDEIFGIAGLADMDTYKGSLQAIAAESAADAAAAKVVAADAAESAMLEWVASLPSGDSAKCEWVRNLFTSTSVGLSHVAAYAAYLTVGAPKVDPADAA